jgi:hypothetical protein
MARCCFARERRRRGGLTVSAARVLLITAVVTISMLQAPAAVTPASNLLDLSGICWIEGDLFVAVHDGKNPDENERPRVSLVYRATSPAGILWEPLDVVWDDPLGFPNDFESIARIPGTRQLLLVESGDDSGPFQRIFLATLSPSNQLTIDQTVNWPEPVFNVEASAVAELDGTYYFVYAERAEGRRGTLLRSARMELNPLSFGTFQSAPFRAPGPYGEGFRPIVSLEFDSSNNLYAATAFDSGDDNGPFRSFVSFIAKLRPSRQGGARLVMNRWAPKLASLDGLKIEGVAVREESAGLRELYAGTDDENYGATMRPVWPLE